MSTQKRKNTNQGMKTKPRTPEEWRAAIETIEDERIRTHAATVVYWDFFGTRGLASNGVYRKPWTHLDDYVDRAFSPHHPPMITSEDELYAALIQVGYEQEDAYHRSRSKGRDGKGILPTRTGVPLRRKTDAPYRFVPKRYAI